MFGLTIPSWLTGQVVGYGALLGIIIFGLNAIHNHGYAKRDMEVKHEKVVEAEKREEATIVAQEVIIKGQEEILEKNREIKERLDVMAKDAELPVAPVVPKPPSTPPKPPTTVVKTETTIIATPGVIFPPVIEESDDGDEIHLLWQGYQLAKDRGMAK